MPDTVLGAGQTEVNRKKKNPCSHRSHIVLGEEKTDERKNLTSKVCSVVICAVEKKRPVRRLQFKTEWSGKPH